jgi:lipopolysaccharide transport system ATP-binding protein
MTDIAISVSNLSKCYQVFDNQRAKFLHALWPNHAKGMQEVWALNDINFEIKRGEAVAIIGRNGGGKSTLLQILTGTLTPTTGEVKVNGRVSALLELGSGFNPEYSGRENVILNGLLLGLKRQDILDRFSEVEAFAEIGSAIDRPVKTYSSGMIMRLAFSVQILLDPEILIIDEALGVGDFFFQQKCFARLRKMRDEGLTLLFVSHDMGTVRDVCQRSLYLKSGKSVFFGDTSTAIRMFMTDGDNSQNLIETANLQQLPSLYDQMKDYAIWSRVPNDGERLISVHIYDINGIVIEQVKLGETIRIHVCFRTIAENETLTVSLVIKNRYDQIVTSINSARLGVDINEGQREGYAIFEFEIDMMLEAGFYSFRINLAQPTVSNRGSTIDSTDWLGPIQICWDYENDYAPFLGMFGLPVRGKLK